MMERKIDFTKIEQTEEFNSLKRKKYLFIFPIPALFFLYYLTFPILSAYAKPMMAKIVVGNFTFGYLFGISYYVAIWSLAFFYIFKARQFDRISNEIIAKYGGDKQQEIASTGEKTIGEKLNSTLEPKEA